MDSGGFTKDLGIGSPTRSVSFVGYGAKHVAARLECDPGALAIDEYRCLRAGTTQAQTQPVAGSLAPELAVRVDPAKRVQDDSMVNPGRRKRDPFRERTLKTEARDGLWIVLDANAPATGHHAFST